MIPDWKRGLPAENHLGNKRSICDIIRFPHMREKEEEQPSLDTSLRTHKVGEAIRI